MRNPSVLNRCTVQKPNGSFCDAASADDMPFPICQHHALKLFDRMSAALRAAAGDLSEPPWPKPEPYEKVDRERHIVRQGVYYIRVGDLIKIGYSQNINARIRAYPPSSRLLAVEQGSKHLEYRRHAQFREALVHPKEWFRPTVELIAHINNLRDTPLTAADLAA